jgi:hypothetical protein
MLVTEEAVDSLVSRPIAVILTVIPGEFLEGRSSFRARMRAKKGIRMR